MPARRYPYKKKFKRRYRKPAGLIGRNVGSRLISSNYLNGKVYSFKRKFNTTFTLASNGTTITETHGAFVHALSDLPAYAEFTALFDKYRIAGIRAQIIPRVNVQSIDNQAIGHQSIPPIVTVIDYDDATAQDFTALNQYENAKVHSEYKPFSLYYKPMIAVATYNGAFTGYGSSRKMWIDAASPGVQYYALKWASLSYSASTNWSVPPSWDVIFTYYIQCKYPR